MHVYHAAVDVVFILNQTCCNLCGGGLINIKYVKSTCCWHKKKLTVSFLYFVVDYVYSIVEFFIMFFLKVRLVSGSFETLSPEIQRRDNLKRYI